MGAIRAIRKDGFRKGHPDAINTLWPVGTTARSDLEGLSALTKQLPEALKDLRERAPTLTGNVGDRPSGFPDSMTLDSLPKPEEIEEELKNALRSTPKGLEAPRYSWATRSRSKFAGTRLSRSPRQPPWAERGSTP